MTISNSLPHVIPKVMSAKRAVMSSASQLHSNRANMYHPGGRPPGDHSWRFCALKPANGRAEARVSIRRSARHRAKSRVTPEDQRPVGAGAHVPAVLARLG